MEISVKKIKQWLKEQSLDVSHQFYIIDNDFIIRMNDQMTFIAGEKIMCAPNEGGFIFFSIMYTHPDFIHVEWKLERQDKTGPSDNWAEKGMCEINEISIGGSPLRFLGFKA